VRWGNVLNVIKKGTKIGLDIADKNTKSAKGQRGIHLAQDITNGIFDLIPGLEEEDESWADWGQSVGNWFRRRGQAIGDWYRNRYGREDEDLAANWMKLGLGIAKKSTDLGLGIADKAVQNRDGKKGIKMAKDITDAIFGTLPSMDQELWFWSNWGQNIGDYFRRNGQKIGEQQAAQGQAIGDYFRRAYGAEDEDLLTAR